MEYDCDTVALTATACTFCNTEYRPRRFENHRDTSTMPQHPPYSAISHLAAIARRLRGYVNIDERSHVNSPSALVAPADVRVVVPSGDQICS